MQSYKRENHISAATDEVFARDLSEGEVNKAILLSCGSVAQLKHPKKYWPKVQLNSTKNIQENALTLVTLGPSKSLQ